jgi:hypothetical protein
VKSFFNLQKCDFSFFNSQKFFKNATFLFSIFKNAIFLSSVFKNPSKMRFFFFQFSKMRFFPPQFLKMLKNVIFLSSIFKNPSKMRFFFFQFLKMLKNAIFLSSIFKNPSKMRFFSLQFPKTLQKAVLHQIFQNRSREANKKLRKSIQQKFPYHPLGTLKIAPIQVDQRRVKAGPKKCEVVFLIFKNAIFLSSILKNPSKMCFFSFQFSKMRFFSPQFSKTLQKAFCIKFSKTDRERRIKNLEKAPSKNFLTTPRNALNCPNTGRPEASKSRSKKM